MPKSPKAMGSGSNGHGGRYFYYHCKDGCKERFRADAAREQFFALLNLVSGNKKVPLTYERMLGATSKDDDAERKAELAKVNKELELCRTRLDKAQTKFLDDELTSADYNGIKARLEPEIVKPTKRQVDLMKPNKGQSEMVDFGFRYLANLPKLFTDAGLSLKQRILGSTFPEKLVFENGQCRTYDSGNIFMLIAKSSKGLTKKKDGEEEESSTPSCQVAATGIEPVSTR